MGAYRALAHLIGEDRRVDQARGVTRAEVTAASARGSERITRNPNNVVRVRSTRARDDEEFPAYLDALRADDTGARLFGPQDPTPYPPPLHSNPAPPCPPTKSAPRTSW